MREPIIEPLEPRQLLAAAPFSVGGSPLVHAEDFRLTTFATGLNNPVGMARLSDGSILVATSQPTDSSGYSGAATAPLVRPLLTPGARGSYDIFFNIGSKTDGTTTPATLTTTLTSSDGAFHGTLHPDSLYKLTLTPTRRGRIGFSDLTQLAFGLRNAAGIAVQP